MRYYIDESGDFSVVSGTMSPPCVVVGVALPDATEERYFERFKSLVGNLSATAFRDDEPKGRLLNSAERSSFADWLSAAHRILVCPTILDMASLSNDRDHAIHEAIVAKLRDCAAKCRHDVMRSEVELLARQIKNLSVQQVLRLLAWAHCINRCVQDSLLYFTNRNYDSCWERISFAIDPVQRRSDSAEQLVFKTMLPAWVTSWSLTRPIDSIEELHTEDHPFIVRYSRGDGIDVGALFRDNVHYPSSESSRGLQIADFAATVIARAVRGVVSVDDLQEYGWVMSRSIGRPAEAIGILTLIETPIYELKRRYSGLPEAIAVGRRLATERASHTA